MILSFAISPEVSVVSDDELVKTFKEVVESGSVEETKQFDIDTEKLDFKGKIINVHPNNWKIDFVRLTRRDNQFVNYWCCGCMEYIPPYF